MNLRDQLKEILPDILPRNPAQAIKGTELIEMVKHRLKQDYSDATLRYHFSIMSCDPSSPIAKVEQGQGYYLRTSTIHSVNSARNLFHQSYGATGEEGSMSSDDVDVALARAEKFRSVVQRYLESVQQFPFTFHESFYDDSGANRWRVPDMAVVDWVASTEDEEQVILEQQKLEVHRRLGQAPFRVSSVKLRLELSHASHLEDLYQCLATSEWANSGELLIAAPISDPRLLEEIRKFASLYGVGVISFGLDADILDDMPEPAAIENLSAEEFDSIQGLLQIRRYATPKPRPNFDWNEVGGRATENPDFARFEKWIARCVTEERAMTSREFDDLERKPASVAQEYVA
ncbi:MAG: hypothetical protein AAGF67_16020 [Verrucomicrobiota bacterium]